MRTVILVVSLLLTCAAGPSKDATDISRLGEKPSTVVLSSVSFVQGTINRAGPYWFLVDTGANRSAVDAQVATELHLLTETKTSIEGSAGTVDAKVAVIRRLRVGELKAANLRPTAYDLSGSLAPTGQKTAGIIGFDAMSDYAVLFEPDRGRVAFSYSAETLAKIENATVLPFELDNGIPRVRAQIDGIPVMLRVDTGAAIGDGPNLFINITSGVYQQLLAQDPNLTPYTHFTASGVGGDIEIPVVKAHNLTIGGTSIAQPHLIVQPRVGYFARPDAVGFLGSYAFKAWRGFIVDYPRKRLILLPRSTQGSSTD